MIHVGTSGFSYRHWRGALYPEDLPQAQWLEHYAGTFHCVEINSSFYHLPKEQVLLSWKKRTPPSFRFVLKGSRFVSHRKRLKDCAESVEVFYRRAFLLGRKLAGVLWQLPPGFARDLELLAQFTALLPRKVGHFFEFRHDSWFTTETYSFLKKHRIAFCIHDLQGSRTPQVLTAPVLYVRFHGPSGRYRGSYPDSELKKWARWISDCGATQGYIFFNNDVEGHAVRNAMTLRAFLAEENVPVQGGRHG